MFPRAVPRSLLALALAGAGLMLGGCDVQTYSEAASAFGNGAPPPPEDFGDGGGSGGGGGGGSSGRSFAPVFSEIQRVIFATDCATSSCHAGASPAAGLSLESAFSYANLVGIASSQQPNLQRVEQGDPANSYLIQKLSGTASTGGVMPPTGALPQTEIDIISQWISDGALDDRVQAVTPIRVTSLSPAPNASLTAPPSQIVAGFDRDLDTSTVNAMTFVVRGAGGDASFTDGNEVTINAASISVPGGNPRSAVFDLTGVTMADDTYRVALSGAGASVIMDIDSNALDGEFSGSFPSGNGVAGGNFTAQFSISTPVPMVPTLDQIQATLFTPRCATCHSGPAGGALPSGLDLSSADASYQNLVGVSSTQNAAFLRVAPNDPDSSYLVQKLEGNAGPIMPPTGMLPQATIDQVRQWIAAGAAR